MEVEGLVDPFWESGPCDDQAGAQEVHTLVVVVLVVRHGIVDVVALGVATYALLCALRVR